ncbi:MAG: hypothetical protein WD646_06745 [Actinomycetota bacterium]
MQIAEFAPARPPCSVGEREAATTVAARLRGLGLRPKTQELRAPTSPTWAPLLRALFRVWGAAFLAAGWPLATGVLAGLSLAGGVPLVAGLIRFLPLLGAKTWNIAAMRRGTDPESRPLVVTAHLDTHSTAEAPMPRPHTALCAVSGLAALSGAIAGRPGVTGSRWLAAAIAAEAIGTLIWLARRELAIPSDQPDDNTSGLLALVRLADLLSASKPVHSVWIVAAGAGTPGSFGITAFLRSRPDLNNAWVVDIDALGTGEVIASSIHARFPHPGTPPALARAVALAARASGDPLSTRQVRRPHSGARAALRMRRSAIALTGGLRPPAGARGPDPANAERAARVVDRLARLPT